MICVLGWLVTQVSGQVPKPPAGRTGKQHEAPKPTEEQQQLLNYFHLLKEPGLRNALGLSPVQQVKMELYRSRLGRLPVRFVPDGEHPDAAVAAMNTPQKQLERCTQLGRGVAEVLSEKQRASFQRERRDRKLQPVEIHLQPESITLVFRSGPEGKIARSSLRRAGRVGPARPKFRSAWLAKKLRTFSDVSEAILDTDPIVQAVGIKALSTFPLKNPDPKRKAAVARVLLERVRSSEPAVVQEEDLMKALVKVVDASHQDALRDLARNATGIRLRGVVAALCRSAPEEAVAVARSRVKDGRAFSNALEGFVMHGSEAEPHLIKLNEVTKGSWSFLVETALKRIGCGKARPEDKPVARQPTRNPRRSGPVKSPLAGGDSSRDAKTTSEWLEYLRSNDRWDRIYALRHLRLERDKLNLKSLSAAEKKGLVDLCSERLLAEPYTVGSSAYGSLLLEFANRSSVPVFEKLVRSGERRYRRFGLAGLMKFSRDKALEASVELESERMGIFLIRDAAKLAGPVSLPILMDLRSRLNKGTHLGLIDHTIKSLK
jgi:hypothetical protein